MDRVTIVVFTLLYALYYSTSCLAFEFSDCGSTLGKFTEVSVSGCQQSDEKCILTRGKNATISIKFIANKDIPQVNARVYGILINVPIPFPLYKPNVCKDPDSGTQCPLKKHDKYHYTTTMLVEKLFPRVSVEIKWEFINNEDEKIICILFPAKLQ